MVDAQIVSVVVAAASGVAAAAGSIVQSKKAERMRKTELFMQLFSPFSDPALVSNWNEIVHHWKWMDYDDYWKKYGQKETEATKLVVTASFFNSLGLLVKMGLLDVDTVRRWSPEACLWLWEKVEPVVLGARERLKASGRAKYRIWENVEYLCNELKEGNQTLQTKP